MDSRKRSDYPGIEAHVRHAKAERAAYIGHLIGTGIVTLTHGVGRAFTTLAGAWRPKRRLAPR